MKRYQIGDVIIQWKDGNFELESDEFTELFQIIKGDEGSYVDEIVYEIHYANLEKYKNETLLQKNGLYELYETVDGKFLVFHWATCRFAFGFYVNDLEKGNIVTCYFNPEMKNQIPLAAVRFFSCAGLHSKLLQKGALVFHSSYMDWNGQAILFAGKSGVGKSTQASLWEKHAGAEIINGDRTLLRKKGGIWHAYGYPCCGSSDICINRTLPLKAIVILEQGNENKVETLTMGQKYRALFTGSEMYLWYEKEMERVNRLVEEIMTGVRIIKLVCRPDADAVEVLKTALEE